MTDKKLLTAFPLGEIRPGFHGRVDTDVFQSALALCRNALPLDGVRNRCGVEFKLATDLDVFATLPFVASTGDPYIIVLYRGEFDFPHVRIMYQGDWVESGGSPIDLTVITQVGYRAVDDPVVGHVRYSQVADELYVLIPNYFVFRILRRAHDDWGIAQTPLGETPATYPVPTVAGTTVINGRFLGHEDTQEVPFRFRANRVYRGVEFTGPFIGGSTSELYKVPYLYDLDEGKWAAIWNNLIHEEGDPAVSRWVQIGATTAYYYNVDLNPHFGLGVNGVYNLFQEEASPGRLIPRALDRVATQALCEAEEGTWFYGAAGGHALTLVVNVGHHPYTGWPAPPGNDEFVATVLTFTDINYRVYGALGTASNSVDNLGLISDRTIPFIEFIGTGPDINYGAKEFEDDLPFGRTEEKTDSPLALLITQQRQWIAGTIADRNDIHASRLGGLDQFGFNTPLRADDALDLTLASERVDRIRHLLPYLGGVVVFTNGDVWLLQGDGGIAFDSVSLNRMVLARVSNDVQPLLVDGHVIFVDETNRVLETIYDNNIQNWRLIDHSDHASHLFKDRTIVSMAWQANPGRTLWAVLDDGTVLSCVISADFTTWGWSKQTLGGDLLAKSVLSLPIAEGVDEPWFWLEKDGVSIFTSLPHHGDNTDWTSETARFVDCWALFESATPEVEWNVFVEDAPWLDNTVTVVADGQVIENVPVTVGGDINLDPSVIYTSPAYPVGAGYHQILIGFPYEALARTLPVNVSPDKSKRVSQVTVRIRQTQGLQVGIKLDAMEEMKSRAFENYDVANELQTGTRVLNVRDKWTRDGQFYLRQSRPMPMAVEGMVPVFTKGEP